MEPSCAVTGACDVTDEADLMQVFLSSLEGCVRNRIHAAHATRADQVSEYFNRFLRDHWHTHHNRPTRDTKRVSIQPFRR